MLRADGFRTQTGVGLDKATVGSAVPEFPDGLAVDRDAASTDNSRVGEGGKAGGIPLQDAAACGQW
jgi:hypothetical protein